MRVMRARRRRQAGQALVVLALVGTAVFGFGAIALDQGVSMADRRTLQADADAAALAGARSGTVNAGNWVALQYLAKMLNFSIATLSGPTCTSSSACPAGTYTAGAYSIALGDNGSTSLDVSLGQTRHTLIAGVIGDPSVTTSASARAGTGTSTVGGPCVLCILDPTASGALSDSGSGSATVSGGNIVVNSSSTSAGTLTGSGSITASGAIDVVGHTSDTGSGRFSPSPTTGASAVSDQLSGVAVPSVSGTSSSYSLTTSSNASINPGIYSTISVTGSGTLTLNAGIYVITGSMSDTGSGSIIGNGVLLYFACSSYPTACTSGQKGGSLTLTGSGSYTVTAPSTTTCESIAATCPYEGLLVFYDRNNAASMSITGSGSSGPTGTIYAKSAALTLTGSGGTVNALIIVDTATITGSGSINLSFTSSQNYQSTGSTGLLR